MHDVDRCSVDVVVLWLVIGLVGFTDGVAGKV